VVSRVPVPVDWGDWESFRPLSSVSGPPDNWPRRVARQSFDLITAERFDRIAAPRQLLERNGVAMDVTDMNPLTDWLIRSMSPSPDDLLRPADRWFAVGRDVGLWFGEVLIARSDGRLRWSFHTGSKRSIGYHWHVVAGRMDGIENHRHVESHVSAMMHRILDGHDGGWLP
jgi:hypothetical protein